MKKICIICDKDGAVYKCPTCRDSYCSVVCCKEHKKIGCILPEPQSIDANLNIDENGKYDFLTEDTVPLEKLMKLRESKEVKDCLKNPHVRTIINAILKDSNPTKAIALAMTEPIFVELADACLKVVEIKENK
ncbi:zinc finger HIT domain-containing protein 3 [Vespa crabro]|uniref:zinc finger HIT domain-containing protein 3 n=1 Tax=Vespa crabro TaxID=7445 RepID=UPI001F01F070|nr:zinc finger HIT domain-containing protein 3 [Vespa crabro]